MPQRGVLYVALGEFVREARLSAQRVKEVTDLETAIVTDRVPDDDCFDYVIEPDVETYGFRDKPGNIHLSPFDRTLYLDTDTYLARSLNGLWGVLDGFDIGLSIRAKNAANVATDVPDGFPEHNAGVILLDTGSSTVAGLIEAWRGRMDERDDELDQLALQDALFHDSDVRLCTLPTEYNCRWTQAGQLSEPVRILHGRLVEFDHDHPGIGFEGNISIDGLTPYDYAERACRRLDGGRLRTFITEGGTPHVKFERP